MLISIEIMLLAITFLILVSSLSFDDILGQTYAIYIIAIAGAESAIGLGILVAFYRLNSSLILSCLPHGHTTYSKNVNKFSSKRIVRCYSTMAKNNDTTNQPGNYSIDPWFLTGFVDAEGCFTLGISRNKYCKTGWSIQLFFQIALHRKDAELLERIQNYFGVGKIHKHGPQSIILRISSIKDLQVLFNHFDKYPLVTQKLADYNLFKLAYNIMINKEHLTQEGLLKLVAIKGSLNLGLAPELQSAFPMVINADKPLVKGSAQKLPNPSWLAGFATGEGCFYVVAQKRATFKMGYSFKLRFSIAQHNRDEALLKSLIDYLGCGILYENRETFELVFTNFTEIEETIVPFFVKYPIAGIKYLDFQDFCKVADIIKEKGHLTIEGRDAILKIKQGMNTGRII